MGLKPRARRASIFPSRWTVEHPDRIQLYSIATPNGNKVAVALEEMGLPYEAHSVNIMKGDQFDPEYLLLNPNNKIPSIIDPNGPGGKPLALMESGAILMYLAEKSGKLMPRSATQRWEVSQWLFFQMASIGPFFGQFGHFIKFARGKTTDDYALDRYTNETKRLLGVLDKRLADRTYLVGERFTIADVATFPWIKALGWYDGLEHLEYDTFTNVDAYLQRCLARPKVKRGLAVTPFPDA